MKEKIAGFLLRYSILICISALIAGLFEFAFLSKLLFLEEEYKGVNYIYDMTISEDGAYISVDLGGQYVDKLAYEFDFNGKTAAQVYIHAENVFGKPAVLVKEDRCSSLLDESVINIGKRVSKVELHFNKEASEEGTFDTNCITAFKIDNTADINWYRVMFVFICCFLLGFLLIERKRLVRRVEIIFLVFALVIGTFMVFSIPASKAGWDEEIHFLRSYSLSVYPGAMELSAEASEWFVASEGTWPFNVPDTIEEREDYKEYVDANCNYNTVEIQIGSGLGFPYFTGYLAQGLMLKIARNLGCSFTLMYQLGRLGNLLLYSVIMTLAIRRTPCGKWIMAVISLMPTTLFVACTYSYDATVTSFIYLAIAYFLYMLLTPNYEFRWKDYLIMGAVFVIGCLPKSVYAPLALIGFMLPKRIFKNKKQMWMARGGLVAAFAVMVGLNILPTVISPAETGDLRGGETSEAGQMSYVLGQPFVYAGVLLNNIFRTLPEYFAGDATFGLLGHLKASPLGFWIYALVIAVMFTDTIREEDRDKTLSLNWKHKAGIWAVSALAVALIWTALYISYTEPGNVDIQGVQGRYYIPLLFLIYMTFNNNKIKNGIERSWYNVCVAGFSGFILMATIWLCIVSVVCL